MEETRAVKVTEAELWELRALQWGLKATKLEIQINETKFKNLDSDMKDLLGRLMTKYGDVNIDTDGTIVYPKEKE